MGCPSHRPAFRDDSCTTHPSVLPDAPPAGTPPSQVERCNPGLPTVAILMCSCRAFGATVSAAVGSTVIVLMSAPPLQMQPRGLGIPAIRAATFAGPLGNSSYSSLMETPDALPNTRTVGPVPFSRYSLLMKRMTCQ